ncbi:MULTISPECIES: DUF447 domain-containing protein [Haloferax]|uniref:DUF447 family protein n=1 Tax=Haloferax marinum TaxID=2666143 RepID=A0A6A8GAG7_9EURY|nr:MULTISPECIES: DUF447 domain-containing protein [Haloferax]KAB1198487.1 DUF447 family protein [Haloferax sp. CBA1150]MRW97592.1 DUF447 family protein [Haloferax marinum]
MTDEPSGAVSPSAAEWPVELRGVTESVVATLGPNDRWNLAALGLHAPDSSDEPVTATTWGNTRTRRNFHRQGGGVVQFVSDPRAFVEAAMTIYEVESPVLDAADAWVEVGATMVDSGDDEGTHWEQWELTPVDAAVEETRPFTINRGFGAVVDATVAASRLDVPAFDTDDLLARLEYFAETVQKCGGPREREAFARIDELTGWRERASQRRNESF